MIPGPGPRGGGTRSFQGRPPGHQDNFPIMPKSLICPGCSEKKSILEWDMVMRGPLPRRRRAGVFEQFPFLEFISVNYLQHAFDRELQAWHFVIW